MSRLVAGSGLSPDEVQSYPDCGLGNESRATIHMDDSSRRWRPVELEAIDLLALAPVYLLLAAQEKADELIAQAQAAAAEIREQARSQGEEEGREAAKRDLLPSLIAFADAGQSLIVFEARMISEYGQRLVELALAIAEKIIGQAISADEQIVASVLERAKTEAVHAKHIRIWLHPDDWKLLDETRPELLNGGIPGGRTIEVVGSLEISRGGCRLETEMGIIDATIPTQIEEVRRQLLGDETYGANGGEPAN